MEQWAKLLKEYNYERKKLPNYSSNFSNVSEDNKTTCTNKNVKDFYSFYI